MVAVLQPYRAPEGAPEIGEHPFFPRVGDLVSVRPIAHIEGRTCRACFGRVGSVEAISRSVYRVRFEDGCARRCGGAVASFVIDELLPA